ncbi:hypothetical protein NMY22_g3281 [Coprinellus aureogranulatus]|nr:hypothetical protein NMY22_g3281 [Coprinellus aureogranulatus]
MQQADSPVSVALVSISNTSSSPTSSTSSTIANAYHGMREEAKSHRYGEIDPLDFAQHVWGLDRATGELLLQHDFTLDPTTLDRYNAARTDERAQKHFFLSTKTLLRDVHAVLDDAGVPYKPKKDGVWHNRTRISLPGPRRRSPSMLSFWEPLRDVPSWEAVKHAWEVKYKPPKVALEARRLSPEPRWHHPYFNPIDSDSASISSHSSKGSYRSAQNEGDSDGGDAKRRRLDDEFVPADVQIATYALECLAATTTGSCWLALRPSASRRNPMSQCDKLHAGFDPHLQPWPSYPTRVITEEMEDKLEQRPVSDIVGSYFEFPPATGSSSVDEPCSVLHRCYRVISIIHQPNRLIGRSTSVYKVQKQMEDGSFSDKDYVLKMSWPLIKQAPEADVVCQLKKALQAGLHGHLPNFDYATSFTCEQLCLPWTKLQLPLDTTHHEGRELRYMVSDHYLKLWEAGSIDDFKRIWLDCVECHHEAYRLGKTLHRDVSDNNLMFYRAEDGTAKGVLNDWDMAAFLGEATVEEVDNATPKHPTGTPPFMAIDLLRKKPRPHWYRHDLESFFYILIWAAVHYDLSERTRAHNVHRALRPLTESKERNSDLKKRLFILYDEQAEDIFDAVRPEFTTILEDWIKPLREVFMDARKASGRAIEKKDATYVQETYNGALTFKTFMETINAEPRWDKG